MVDDVKGLRSLQHVMRQLPDRVRKKVVNASLREAAKVVQDAGINNALSQFQGEGAVAENITFARGKARDRTQLRYRVGVAGGAVAPAELRAGGQRASQTPIHRRGKTKHTGLKGFVDNGQVYYWRFLEFGTSKMAARPFMRPAGSSTVAMQSAVLRRVLRRGIEREARKLARGAR
jgi:HK97 gp10 family phage protein